MTNVPLTRDRAYERALRGDMSSEVRAVLDATMMTTSPGAPSSASAGYLAGYMVPQRFAGEIATGIKAAAALWADSDPLSVHDAQPIPVPQVDMTGQSAYILPELTQIDLYGAGRVTGGTVAVDWQTGQKIVGADTYVAGQVVVSQQFLTDQGVDFPAWIGARFAELYARKVGADMWGGTAAVSGIVPALTAYGTGNASGGLLQGNAGGHVYIDGGSANALASQVPSITSLSMMIDALDSAYWPDAAFYMSQDTYSLLSRCTTSSGFPLVTFDGANAPGSLMGFKIRIDPAAGSVSSSASTVGGIALAAASKAIYSRVSPYRVVVNKERWVEFMSVGFSMWTRAGAQLVDPRAAVLYKSPAS